VQHGALHSGSLVSHDAVAKKKKHFIGRGEGRKKHDEVF